MVRGGTAPPLVRRRRRCSLACGPSALRSRARLFWNHTCTARVSSCSSSARAALSSVEGNGLAAYATAKPSSWWPLNVLRGFWYISPGLAAAEGACSLLVGRRVLSLTGMPCSPKTRDC